ncbi:MAG: methyltransferase domain-containing protein [Acidimicrobiia bacterium]
MSTEDIYTHGHHPAVVFAHGTRTIANSAAYLAPHLVKGMRLLDVGCGPGSITCEMAAAIAPGEVVGVDADTGVLDVARARARKLDLAHIEFEGADVYDLPFEDGSFDVTHAHQVLQHLARPVDALLEMRRVTVTGGLVAARDADYGTMVHSPRFEGIDRWRSLYTVLGHRAGHEPNAGRELAGWFAAAGLEQHVVTTSTWQYATPDERHAWAEAWTNRIRHARMHDLAVELGLATEDELEAMAADWERWADHPNGYFAFLHGEVVATIPG